VAAAASPIAARLETKGVAVPAKPSSALRFRKARLD